MRARDLLLLIPAMLVALILAPRLQPQGVCYGGTVAGVCLPPAAENEVWGVSEILAPYSSQIVGYSATELGANVQLYYDAYTEGRLYQSAVLYQNPTFVDGYNSYSSSGLADGYVSAPVLPNLWYQLQTSHYLVEYFSYYDAQGDPYYSNPEGFLESSDDTGDSGDFEPNSGGDLYTQVQYLALGATAWQVNTTPPYINAIDNAGTGNPASASLNSSGYFEIYGTYLASLNAAGYDTPQVSVSGTGVTLSVSYTSDTQVNVQYTVASNATTGAHGITITTYAGTSNTVNMNVGDPTPAITSVSPNSWNAGTTVGVTIGGTGFGTNPTLTIFGTGISSYGERERHADFGERDAGFECAERDGEHYRDIQRLRERVSGDAARAAAEWSGECEYRGAAGSARAADNVWAGRGGMRGQQYRGDDAECVCGPADSVHGVHSVGDDRDE